MADHHIEVVNLQGRGGDEVAERSVIEWLETLQDACKAAGVTLSQARPDVDDAEGWIALLGESGDEGAEARDALDLIERKAREGNEWETVIEVLLDGSSTPATVPIAPSCSVSSARSTRRAWAICPAPSKRSPPPVRSIRG